MQNQLQKAINLIRKTGDRLIVFDSAKPGDIYIILSLKDYENLVLGRSEVRNLTEDELLDKINRDIAIWKSDQDSNNNYGDSACVFTDNAADDTEKGGDYSKVPVDDTEREGKDEAVGAWTIPAKRKQNAEEVIEEDRQYLEEVSF